MESKKDSHKLRVNGKANPGKVDIQTLPPKLLISLWRVASETGQEPLCEKLEAERARRRLDD